MRKLEAYVEEMASTDNVVEDTVNMQKIQDYVLKLWNIVKS